MEATLSYNSCENAWQEREGEGGGGEGFIFRLQLQRDTKQVFMQAETPAASPVKGLRGPYARL